ncbi:hypothetical protein [Streptomyces lavendulae]|uniref:hypothetical protein n=1 Tax=Streptomyces lavendulae TaxID=1914 RepID=UPI00131DBE4D|nr:hypothetical protein [Streptomyces lavendulae]
MAVAIRVTEDRNIDASKLGADTAVGAVAFRDDRGSQLHGGADSGAHAVEWRSPFGTTKDRNQTRPVEPRPSAARRSPFGATEDRNDHDQAAEQQRAAGGSCPSG